MEDASTRPCTAFFGTTRFTSGALRDVAREVMAALRTGDQRSVLVFDDVTGQQVDLDLRETQRIGSDPSSPTSGDGQGRVGSREEAPKTSRPGRPRLGVVSREVTLLPRHWEWLNAQPGGASAALRRLVDQARRVAGPRDKVRSSQEAAYRFLSAMAGNEPGFEEAVRALFARNATAFTAQAASWPADVRAYALRLAEGAFLET